MDDANPGGLPALQGRRSLVAIPAVTDRVAERLHGSLQHLLHQARGMPLDADRRTPVLGYLHSARQQLLRLHALLCWSVKAKVLRECVDSNRVLDIAAQHARMMQLTADELFAASGHLKLGCQPNDDVQTALELMTTGTYAQLPTSIKEPLPPVALSKAAKHSLLRSMDHLISVHLCKGGLPDGVQLVAVGGGCATLRAPGLYEVKVVLVETERPLPGIDGGSTAAAQDADKPDSCSPSRPAADAVPDTSAQAPSSSEPQQSPKRWRWALKDVALVPGSGRGAGLQPVQLQQLASEISSRMFLEADATLYRNQARSSGNSVAGGEGGPGSSGDAAAASSSAMEGLGKDGQPQQEAEKGGTQEDEHGAALRLLHQLLREVAGRILLDSVSEVAQGLVASGGRWEGALQKVAAEKVVPGVRLRFWLRSALVYPAGTSGLEGLQGAAPGLTPPPAVEVGLGASGSVEVLQLPTLQGESAVQLQLDPRTVDVEHLLLTAAAGMAKLQLGNLQKQMQQVLGGGHLVGLLVDFSWGSAPVHPTSTQPVQQALAPGPAAATSASQHRTGGQEQDGEVVQNPMLELHMVGGACIRVCYNLWTGRLLLQAQPVGGGDDSLEVRAAAHQVEESIARLQNSAANGGLPQVPAPGQAHAALVQAAHDILRFCQSQAKTALMAGMVQATMRLSLSAFQVMGHVVRAHVQAHPYSPEMLSRPETIYFCFPLLPPPRGVPRMDSVAARPMAPQLAPRSLQFSLALTWPQMGSLPFTLVAFTLSDSGIPLQVVSCTPVPQHVFATLAPCGSSVLRKRKREDSQPDSLGAQLSGTSNSRKTSFISSLSDDGQASGSESASGRCGRLPRVLQAPQQVVAVASWCRSWMVRLHLLAQLDALGLSYTLHARPPKPGPPTSRLAHSHSQHSGLSSAAAAASALPPATSSDCYIQITSAPGLFSMPYHPSTSTPSPPSSDTQPQPLISEIWFYIDATPSHPGAWSCWLLGTFSSRPPQPLHLCTPDPAPPPAPGAPSTCPTTRTAALSFSYDITAGDSVVTALLDILQVINMQNLLSRLHTLLPPAAPNQTPSTPAPSRPAPLPTSSSQAHLPPSLPDALAQTIQHLAASLPPAPATLPPQVEAHVTSLSQALTSLLTGADHPPPPPLPGPTPHTCARALVAALTRPAHHDSARAALHHLLATCLHHRAPSSPHPFPPTLLQGVTSALEALGCSDLCTSLHHRLSAPAPAQAAPPASKQNGWQDDASNGSAADATGHTADVTPGAAGSPSSSHRGPCHPAPACDPASNPANPNDPSSHGAANGDPPSSTPAAPAADPEHITSNGNLHPPAAKDPHPAKSAAPHPASTANGPASSTLHPPQAQPLAWHWPRTGAVHVCRATFSSLDLAITPDPPTTQPPSAPGSSGARAPSPAPILLHICWESRPRPAPFCIPPLTAPSPLSVAAAASKPTSPLQLPGTPPTASSPMKADPGTPPPASPVGQQAPPAPAERQAAAAQFLQSAAGQVRCRISSSSAALPEEFIHELEEMVHLGAEDTLLAALAVCCPALAELKACMAAEVQASWGRLPGEVQLVCWEAPYRWLLTVAQAAGPPQVVDVQLAAGGLVLLGLRDSAGGQQQQDAPVKQELGGSTGGGSSHGWRHAAEKLGSVQGAFKCWAGLRSVGAGSRSRGEQQYWASVLCLRQALGAVLSTV